MLLILLKICLSKQDTNDNIDNIVTKALNHVLLLIIYDYKRYRSHDYRIV